MLLLLRERWVTGQKPRGESADAPDCKARRTVLVLLVLSSGMNPQSGLAPQTLPLFHTQSIRSATLFGSAALPPIWQWLSPFVGNLCRLRAAEAAFPTALA